jgi:integrase
VRALRRWLQVSGITSGPIFRPVDRHGRLAADALSGHAVARIVQRSCRAAGLDPKDFGAHSLRSGMATQAARSGVSERSIMAQTGTPLHSDGPSVHPRRFAISRQRLGVTRAIGPQGAREK